MPNEKRAIFTKWVFRCKKDERGIVVRDKVRLVAQEYIQEEGIEYDQVFAPVARIKAIRLFLAYASYKDFVVYQIDVKSAFLYGTTEEEVYVWSLVRVQVKLFRENGQRATPTSSIYVIPSECQPGRVPTRCELRMSFEVCY